MKKSIKKLLYPVYKLLPKSKLINKLKCLWYSSPTVRFGFNGLYITSTKEFSIKTNEYPYANVKYYNWFFKYYNPCKEDIVIDAGGYNGHFASMLGKLVSEGKVYSFECDPFNIKMLEDNILLNNLKGIVIPVQRGLWNKDEEMEFYSSRNMASSLYFEAPHSSKILVKLVTLDDYCMINNITNIKYIKMNIEGAEVNALKGAEKVLRTNRPKLVITTDHFVNGKLTTEDVENFLKSLGYKAWTEKFGNARVTYAEFLNS